MCRKLCILFHIGYSNETMLHFYFKTISAIVLNPMYNCSLSITVNENIRQQIEDYLAKYVTLCDYKLTFIPNIGADLLPYHSFILENEEQFDYVLKMHTKQTSMWTCRLMSVFMNLDDIFQTFETDPTIAIVGHARYLQPLFFGLSDSVSSQMREILASQFGITEEGPIDYIATLDEQTSASKKETSFDAIVYSEYREDLFHAGLHSHRSLEDHFKCHKHQELIHAGVLDAMERSNFLKFIAGTIFIVKGDVLVNVRSKYRSQLTNLLNSYEREAYYSNFDQNGTLFRFTNCMEYLLQALVYNLGYRVSGYRRPDFLNNSITVRNNKGNIVNALVSMKTTEQEKKEKSAQCSILFISNELSDTGAPIMLLKLIQKVKHCHPLWNCFVLSSVGGCKEEAFRDTVGVDNMFLVHKDHRCTGMECFAEVASLVRAMADTIQPDIVYVNTLVNVSAIYGAFNGIRKIVLHVHEAADEIITLYNNNLIIGYEYIRLVNTVITVNAAVKQNIVEMCGGGEGQTESHCFPVFEVIGNDIDQTVFNNHDPEQECLSTVNEGESKRSPSCRFTVGGVGTLNMRKGFDIFVSLATMHPGCRFIWSSSDHWNEEYTLPSNVSIVHNSHKTMPNFYKSVDFLMITSRSESFPLAFWECLLCGTYAFMSSVSTPLTSIFDRINYEPLHSSASVATFDWVMQQLVSGQMDHRLMYEKIDMKLVTEEIVSNNLSRNVDVVDALLAVEPSTIQAQCMILPSEFEMYREINVYQKILSYGLQPDLLQHRFRDIDGNLHHYVNHGYHEERQLYRFPCLVKKRLVFYIPFDNAETKDDHVTHSLLHLASTMQDRFDVVIVILLIDVHVSVKMIDEFFFMNDPVFLPVTTLRQAETVSSVIHFLDPDAVFLMTSVCQVLCDACSEKNIPMILCNFETTCDECKALYYMSAVNANRSTIRFEEARTDRQSFLQKKSTLVDDVIRLCGGLFRSKRLTYYQHDKKGVSTIPFALSF